MTKKYTTEEFINKANEIHNNKYDYSIVNYTNSTTKIKIICPIHGEFLQAPSNHLQGQQCPKCKKSLLSNLYKYTTQEFISKANEVHDCKYDYSKVNYKDTFTKILIICPIHGEFLQTPANHLQGQQCPKCSIRNIKYTVEEFISKANEVHNSKYNYELVDYKKIYLPVKIICPIHGEFLQEPKIHIRGSGCPKCKNKSNTSIFINKALEIHDKKYNYELVNYTYSNLKIKIICPKHGIFEQLSKGHLQGHGCPICSHPISQGQQEIYDWIKTFNINCNLNDRNLLSKIELDITIPDLKLAIEYNGIWWHSLNAGKQLDHLYNKYIKAKTNGIKLINIYEDEWLNVRLQMEQIIKNALGIISNKIAARKCTIWEVKSNSKYFSSHIRPFFNLYHHQGLKYLPNSIALCLVYENEIICCALFGQNSYHTQTECELIRYATKADIKVQGGLSKLISHFNKHNTHIKSIISFCDNRFFTGYSYEKIGFKKVAETPIGFDIIKNDSMKRRHRSSIVKNKLTKYFTDTELNTFTQKELAIRLNWLIVPDCGQTKFILER